VARKGRWPEASKVSRETKVALPLSAAEFRALTGSSGEAIERLSVYLELLKRWQRRINLVAASTLADPWRRHILDSAQLAPLLPDGNPRLIDLGSGAGFPGLVLAILGDARVCLVDSDFRKCAFLHEAARVTQTDVRIENARIECLPAARYDIVVGRAVAPLARLLGYADELLAPDGRCLFLKGRDWSRELTHASESWTMGVEVIRSRSDPAGVVLRIEKLSHGDDR
jgi:16S rRNA (guanine527-N7)-methyltransferase